MQHWIYYKKDGVIATLADYVNSFKSQMTEKDIEEIKFECKTRNIESTI